MVGDLVCEVTAVGKYAGRPLKAGAAALPALCLLGSGHLEMPYTECQGLVYGMGLWDRAVHGIGYLVYGKGKKRDAVYGMPGLVYGDKDYDENGQEKGAYFGSWVIVMGGAPQKGGF